MSVFDSTSTDARPVSEPSPEPVPHPEPPSPHSGHDPRTGRFLPENTDAIKHGQFSRRAQDAELPGQEQLRAAIAERRIEWIADLGDELSFGERDLVNRGLRLHVILDTLEANMERNGVLTSKGHKRAAVTLYLAVLDRLTRLYQQLGLERRTKRIDTIADIVREHSGSR